MDLRIVAEHRQHRLHPRLHVVRWALF